jgi:hypothetical protein
MTDIRKLSEKQAAWQKSRQALSWPEKIRMAEAIRESIVKLRRTGPDATRAGPAKRGSSKPQ